MHRNAAMNLPIFVHYPVEILFPTTLAIVLTASARANRHRTQLLHCPFLGTLHFWKNNFSTFAFTAASILIIRLRQGFGATRSFVFNIFPQELRQLSSECSHPCG